MRSIIKSWQNKDKSRGMTWSRRVKWYEDDKSVRLKFEDNVGTYNKVYKIPEQLNEAQTDYNKFRNGEPVEVWLDGHKFTTEEVKS